MAKDEKKKGKGFFGKIADAIAGDNQPKQDNQVESSIPASNGEVNDATVDQAQEQELKKEDPAAEVNPNDSRNVDFHEEKSPALKKSLRSGGNSFSDMLRERQAKQNASHQARLKNEKGEA